MFTRTFPVRAPCVCPTRSPVVPIADPAAEQAACSEQSLRMIPAEAPAQMGQMGSRCRERTGSRLIRRAIGPLRGGPLQGAEREDRVADSNMIDHGV